MKGRLVFGITKEEKWTLEALSSTFVNLTSQTGQAKDGLNSYIKLLEDKYEAVFAPEQGAFVPRAEAKEPPTEQKSEE